MACLQVMSAAAVVVVIVRQRTQHGKAVGTGGQLRQMLADPESWSTAVDGLEVAAHLVGCIRFQVKCFVLARSAVKKQKDDRFRVGGHRAGLRCCGPQHLRQRKPHQPRSAGLKQGASGGLEAQHQAGPMSSD
jgi:hypothetical protein